jgi:chemotaxis family two-component system response regulator Rcp1
LEQPEGAASYVAINFEVMENPVHAHQSTQARILLVEDNPADCRLIEEGLKSNGVSYVLWVSHDGVQALQRLLRAGPYNDAPRPDLILLDLNLPGISGWDVLRSVKQHPDLLDIPVVVLTSSRARNDIVRAYRNHANSYFCKPTRMADAFALVAEIYKYWFLSSQLPTRSVQC